jgi:hypothetical protein
MMVPDLGQEGEEKYPRTVQWRAYWTFIGPWFICRCGCHLILNLLESMAGTTGLEPATSAVTGQHSNQLNYVPTCLPDLLRYDLHDPSIERE